MSLLPLPSAETPVRVILPPIYAVYESGSVNDLLQMRARSEATSVRITGFPAGVEPDRLELTSADGEKLCVILKGARHHAEQYEQALLVKSPLREDGSLDLSQGEWLRNPEIKSYTRAELTERKAKILDAWADGISYKAERKRGDKLEGGLRPPQIGALHAIASYWTLSNAPATVVMPTGTGKTEVMVAMLVAERPQTLLVIVPTDPLRTQTADKFLSFGVLQDVGIIPKTFPRPLVSILHGVPKDTSDLECFGSSNVVVSTMVAIAGAPEKIQKQLAALCDVVFFDEAHHVAADTWAALRAHFRNKKVVQFTATPFRRDGRRIEGKVIYNYPLAKAQADGYFRKIRFEDVFEVDDAMADAAIAACAVKRLRTDLAAGFQHLMMARVDSISRAEALLQDIYRAQYADLKPVVIHSKVKRRAELLRAIRRGDHRIIICVDMLGEGFDLPELKIAAMHDIHKSLGVTLQFAGRFTRTSRDVGIGEATLVTNGADVRVGEALEQLYAEDADWNKLLPQLSAEAIQPEVHLSEFLTELQSSVPEGESELLAAATLRPKTSAVVYEASQFKPDEFRRALKRHETVTHWWRHPDRDYFCFVLRKEEPLEWSTAKEAIREVLDLYMLFYDRKLKLLFIHSSVKGTAHRELAKAVGGKVNLIEGERMFRVFSGISRLTLYNIGLTKRSRRNLRYRMFSGLDVAPNINPAEQTDTSKANLFGAGWEQGKRASVGCSHKGIVWSLDNRPIPQWMEWCSHIGGKLVDGRIGAQDFLKNTLIPTEVTTLPDGYPLCIEWPEEFFRRALKYFRFECEGEHHSSFDTEVQLAAEWGGSTFSFDVILPGGKASTYRMSIDDSEYGISVTHRGGPELTISGGTGAPQPAGEFFRDHPPIVRFADGSELEGTLYVRPNANLTYQYPIEKIETLPWTGVNLKVESQYKGGVLRTNSVQHYLISELLQGDYDFIIDDDDSGEAADVITVKERDTVVEIGLFHCKYSEGARAGRRAGDMYVVCGQALKGVSWTLDFSRLVDHIQHRETKVLNKRATRFERGKLIDLLLLRKRSARKRIQYFVAIAQPGISKKKMLPEHSSVLGATSLFVEHRLDTPLRVLGST